MTIFRVGSASHVGQVRAKNDDSALVSETAAVYAVADGMGGHRGGDVASAIAVETLEALVTDPTTETLVDAVKEANRRIFDRASDDGELRGMGTTLVAIALVDAPDGEEGQEVAWVNVGDSRVYLFRDGELRQLSRDHSLIEDLRRGGQLSDEEAAVHPQRNILTRALGIDRDVEVDSDAVLHLEGDRFLLCSDGLFNEVSNDGIIATLTEVEDPAEAVARLIDQANEGGGRDNITCVVADVTDDGGRSARAAAVAAAAAAAATAGDDSDADEGEAEAGAATPTVELPPADPDDPEGDRVDPTAPTVEVEPATGTDADATPPGGMPVPPPPPTDGDAASDEPTTETLGDDRSGPPPPPPPDDPELGTPGVAAAAAAGGAVTAGGSDDGPGRPPTDGPFPTPSDPGFPGDGSDDDGERDGDGDGIDLPFGRGERGLYEDMDKAGGRHWALTLLGVLVVLGLLGLGAYKGLEWYGNQKYFLDTEGDEVVIRQGRWPDGFLVFDATTYQRTERTLDELEPEVREEVEARRQFGSAANALSRVNNGTLPPDEGDGSDDTTTTTTEAETPPDTGSETTDGGP